jgi:endonuclease/exonuclease/phosphatase family metal-dependent hydrolase
VRLLSWNVQWCRGLDGLVDPARIVREARRLADPDVLCLQEVSAGFADLPGSRGEDQRAALENELPGYALFYGAAVDVPAGQAGRARFGNVIASRLPVGRVLRHTLPWPPTRSPSMPRAALEATVQAPFGAVRITSTHLEYYSSRQRAAQVERLRELHCEVGHENAEGDAEGPFRPLARPRSAIVCGDFNMPPQDPLRARFLEAFLEDGTPKLLDAWEAVHPGEPHPPTFRLHERDAGEQPYCCDFVFVSEDLRPRLKSIMVDGMNRASDHQPVVVELA